MSIETERLIHDTPPTQEQLHQLVSIGARSATARERFKTFARQKGVHYFFDELDLMTETVEEDIEAAHVRHRMAARVGVRPATETNEKIWSLKYFDTYFVEAEPGQWRGERSTYRFEWTRSRILMAERSLRLLGFGVDYDRTVDELTDFNVNFRDDEVAILHATDQLRQVTRDDCDELITTMTSYFETIDVSERSS